MHNPDSKTVTLYVPEEYRETVAIAQRVAAAKGESISKVLCVSLSNYVASNRDLAKSIEKSIRKGS